MSVGSVGKYLELSLIYLIPKFDENAERKRVMDPKYERISFSLLVYNLKLNFTSYHLLTCLRHRKPYLL
jgi:hypothetical protein